MRLRANIKQLQQEIALLRAEIRIDARLACLPAQRRPHYPPCERLEILQVRAARAWSLQQTADALLVTAATISSWMHRLEETGPKALVQLRTPAAPERPPGLRGLDSLELGFRRFLRRQRRTHNRCPVIDRSRSRGSYGRVLRRLLKFG